MSDYQHLASFSNVVKDWIDYCKSNVDLFSDYGLSYVNTVLNLLNLHHTNDTNTHDKTNATTVINDEGPVSFVKPLAYYDNLLHISNSEFSNVFDQKTLYSILKTMLTVL